MADSFRSDLLASGGMDDRRSRNEYLTRAEELMADAVGSGRKVLVFSQFVEMQKLPALTVTVAVATPKPRLTAATSPHKKFCAQKLDFA